MRRAGQIRRTGRHVKGVPPWQRPVRLGAGAARRHVGRRGGRLWGRRSRRRRRSPAAAAVVGAAGGTGAAAGGEGGELNVAIVGNPQMEDISR